MGLVRPKAREDLTIVELDGEAVIYDEQTNGLHRLNPTATIVLDLCDGTSTIKEMATEIAGAFGMPVEAIEEQTRTLLRRFREAKLLIPTGSVPDNGRHVRDRTEATLGAP